MPVPTEVLDALDALDEQRDTTSAAKTTLTTLQEQLLVLQDQVAAADARYREEYTKQNDLLAKLSKRLQDEYTVQARTPAGGRPTVTVATAR